MFGYVRPLRPSLLMCEFERYQAVYCGLCHALARHFGPGARWAVNYDFVFLAMLFWQGEFHPVKRRCIRHPFRKKPAAPPNPALEFAAHATVLFTIWKLRDTGRDGGFFARMGAGALLFPARRALGRSEKFLPETALAAGEAMRELWALEDNCCESIDFTADAFARMLGALAEARGVGEERRVARSLLCHLGRWIYLADACDDLAHDLRKGRYNPVAARFGLSRGPLPENIAEQMKATLSFSQKGVIDAYALWPRGPFDGILQNIITDGLTARAEALGQPGGKGKKAVYEGSVSGIGRKQGRRRAGD